MKKLIISFCLISISLITHAQTNFIDTENYIAVRTKNRTANKYYEFWDSKVGWAPLRFGTARVNGLLYVRDNLELLKDLKFSNKNNRLFYILNPDNSEETVKLYLAGNHYTRGLQIGRDDLGHNIGLLGNVGIGTNTPTESLSVKMKGASIGLYDENTTSKANNRIARYSNSLVIQNDFLGSWKDNIIFHDNGNVCIGKLKTNYKLDVNGTIRANEIIVEDPSTADFVFEDTYKLKSLREVEQFIKKNKHLPDVASAKEMKANGVKQGEMNAKLLQKIEELTLYLIQIKKETNLLRKENKELNEVNKKIIKNNKTLNKRIQKLENKQ